MLTGAEILHVESTSRPGMSTVTVRLSGRTEAQHAFCRWFGRSRFAAISRVPPAPRDTAVITGHLFLRNALGVLVTELRKTAGSTTELGLEPGAYEVTLVQGLLARPDAAPQLR